MANEAINLNPYPTDISEPANILLQHFRSKDVPTATLAHAAYQTVGVVLGKSMPDNGIAPVAAAARKGAGNVASGKGQRDVDASTEGEGCCKAVACGSDAECCDVLEEACGKKGVRGPLSGLILQQILGIAFQILQDLLKNNAGN